MNKYENPIDMIGVEPSGTEAKMSDLYDNSAFLDFLAVLKEQSTRRKEAKEKNPQWKNS